MKSLENAIEDLYAAFSTVPKPQRIEGCPCCINEKKIEVLLRKDLRELAPDDLSSYASSAFLTVGSVADYLYFLPRILEISALDTSWWPDVEITGRAIKNSDRAGWTHGQRQALDEFLAAVFEAVIQAGEGYQLDDWMCSLSQIGVEVGPYLERIARSGEAILAFFESNVTKLPSGKLANPFWELPCPAHDQIVEWFYSHEIAKVPFDAYGYLMDRES